MQPVNLRRLRFSAAAWGLPLFVGIVAFGCGSTASHPAAAPTTTVATTTHAATTTTPAPDVHVTAASFRNVATMTHIRGFFVTNLMGNLAATVAVADKDSGAYPTGSLLQLVPQEAMVKHRAGWNPSTNDWEFFFLDTSASGTKIVHRGTTEVVNRFGGNCAACHSAATAKFDFVCEHDHGCAPLPVGDDIIRAIQLADPRPKT